MIIKHNIDEKNRIKSIEFIISLTHSGQIYSHGAYSYYFQREIYKEKGYRMGFDQYYYTINERE